MKLSEFWEVWVYQVLVIVYIAYRARELGNTHSNGFLGSHVPFLAQMEDVNPIQQQEGYRQLPRFKFSGDNVREFLQGFPEVCNFWNIHNMVYQDVARPRDPDEAVRWDQANGLALSKLKYYLSDDVYQMVWKGEELTARQFYMRLHAMFLRGDMRSIQVLERALESCQKRSDETLSKWWARLDAIFTEFALRGAPKGDEAKKIKAMVLCGEEWQSMADYLGSPEGVDYVTFQTQMLKRDRERRLFGIAYEQGLADQLSGRTPVDVKRNEAAYMTAVSRRATFRGSGQRARGRAGERGRGAPRSFSANDGGCYSCGEVGHTSRQCTARGRTSNRTARGRSHSFTRSHIVCRNCGGRGHFRDECPSPYYRERGFAVQEELIDEPLGQQHDEEEVKYDEDVTASDYAEEVVDDLVAMITIESMDASDNLDVSEVVALARDEHSIHLDSCCTRHMTGFYDLTDAVQCSRRVLGALRGGKPAYSTEMGTLALGGLRFSNALHVPGLLYTLISEPQLDREGYEMRSSGGKRCFYKDGDLKFTATLKDGTYQLDIPQDHAMAIADAKITNQADLWHFRLGHVNYEDLRRLRDTIPGVAFPNTHKLSFCGVCVSCKMKQTKYNNVGDSCDRPRQILGFDVTGPYPKTPEGFCWCLEVVDYSMLYWQMLVISSQD